MITTGRYWHGLKVSDESVGEKGKDVR